MKRLLIAAGFLFFITVLVFAFRWPVPEIALRSTFAVAELGQNLRGLQFDNQDGGVQAISDGELLFHASGRSLPGNFPVPDGSMVALAHPRDILSVYTGIEQSLDEQLSGPVFEGDILGYSKPGVPLKLFVFDRKAGLFINPLALLPQMADTRAPQLRALSLRLGGADIAADKAKAIAQGQYQLILDALDLLPVPAQALPFSIRLLLNGVERQRLVFDSIKAEKGSLVFPSMLNSQPAAVFTAEGFLNLGTYIFASGSTLVSISLQDYFGNRIERSWTVTVP
ncbi:MAG: hypothetical protein KKI09_13065 [Spirochaetes bacterium]|nr:hypothetical protein [Spirochaetota bacterium]MBU0956353.1 hypothetical protein [Spirochaetota bacterium]